MSKPFDATLKGLLERGPADWSALAGFAGRQVEIIDADVSTVTAASDKVLRVRDEPDWLMDVNFQAGPDASLPRRTHVYNAVLEDRHDLLVRSVVVLLAKQAHLSAINGIYSRRFEGEEPHLVFRYQVIRVWELPTQSLLEGGLGTLPLAPISNVRDEELPQVIERMKRRLRTKGALGKELWVATYILMGLCHDQGLVDQLLRGVISMKESVTYRAIIEQGRAAGLREGAIQEARKTLLVQGTKLLGAPTPKAAAALDKLDNLENLDDMLARVVEASSWEDLLGLPQPTKRRRK